MNRLFHSARHVAAASAERSTRFRLAGYGEAASETQILVVALPHRCCITFWSTVATLHRHNASDFNAHHHIHYQLCFCFPGVCFQLAILEQEV
jgi:hypothetical protein